MRESNAVFFDCGIQKSVISIQKYQSVSRDYLQITSVKSKQNVLVFLTGWLAYSSFGSHLAKVILKGYKSNLRVQSNRVAYRPRGNGHGKC